MKKLIKIFLLICMVCCPVMVQAQSADKKLDQSEVDSIYNNFDQCKDYFTIKLKTIRSDYYDNKSDYSDYVASQITEQYQVCMDYLNNAQTVNDLIQELDDGEYEISDAFYPDYHAFNDLLDYDLTQIKSETDLPRLKVLILNDYDVSVFTSNMNEYYQELYLRDYRVCVNSIKNAKNLIDLIKRLSDLEDVSINEFEDIYDDVYPLGEWNSIDTNLIFNNSALEYLVNLGEAKMDAYIYSQTAEDQKTCQTIKAKAVNALETYQKAQDVVSKVNDSINSMVSATGKAYTKLSGRDKLNYVNMMKEYLEKYNNQDYGSTFSLLNEDYCDFISECTYAEDAKYILKMTDDYFATLSTLDDLKKNQLDTFKLDFGGAGYDQKKVTKLLSDLEGEYKEIYTTSAFYNVNEEYLSKLENCVKVLSIKTVNANSKYGTVTKTTSVEYGDSAKVVIQVKKGYAIKAIYVDGKARKITNYGKMTLTFNNVKKSYTVRVQFEKNILYKVKTSASKHGAVTKTTSVRKGASCTINILPQAGYKIASIKVDGKKYKLVNKIVFKNVKKNHKVKVKFTK